MKNYILLLLLATFGMQAQTYQNPTYGKLKLKTNTESITAKKVNVQETDGTINWQFIKDFQNNKPYFSTGLLKNGLLTINADNTKFDLSAGIGVYSDFSDPENVTSKVFNFPAFSAVVSPYIATSNITYVAINYNGGSPVLVMQAAPFSNTQMRDLVVVGAVIHSNFTTINTINNISSPSNDVGNSVADLFNFLGARNQEGNVYSANGPNLQLNKSAGVILKYGANFHVNAKNPHNVALPEQLSLTFRYRLQDGFEGTDRINVDTDNYDLNNVLTTVPPAKPYQIQTIFIPQTGQTRIQYGQTTYNTLADAVAAINTRKFNVETNLATQFVKVAYLVVKKGTTSLQVVTDADIIQASKFDATASGGVAITYQSIIDALGYVPENVSNKATNFSTVNNTLYPTVQAVNEFAVAKVVNTKSTTPIVGGDVNARMCVSNGLLYVSEYVNNKIGVFSLENPMSPNKIYDFTVGSRPRHVLVSGRNLIVACTSANKIEIYDIQNPQSALKLGEIPTGSQPKMFELVGSDLFVVCAGTSKVEKYKISMPDNSLSNFSYYKVGDVSVGLNPLALSYNGDGLIAVCGDGDNIITILSTDSLSSYSAPFGGAGHGTCAWFNKTQLLVTDWTTESLLSIDYSNLLTPVLSSSITVSENPEQIEIIGNKAYIPSLRMGVSPSYLDFIDLSDAKFPVKIKSETLTVNGAGFTAPYTDGVNTYIYVDGHFAPFNIDAIKIDNGDFHRNENIMENSKYINNLGVANLTTNTIDDSKKYSNTSNPYTVSSIDNVLRLESGTTTLPNPNSVRDGKIITLSNVSNSANVDVVNSFSGLPSLTLFPYESITLQAAKNGATYKWDAIGGRRNLPNIFESSIGSIGIGTLIPNYQNASRRVLDLNGSIESMLAFSINGTASGYLFNSAASLELSAVGARPIYFSNNSGIRASITSGGSFNIANLAGSGDRVVSANTAGDLLISAAPTAPTAAAGTNTTQIATTAFVLAIRPYKVYTALLSQTGTSAPVATVLENTLGGTVVWSRSSTGIYIGTLTGAFVSGKTLTLGTASTHPSLLSMNRVSNDTFSIATETESGVLTDGLLNITSIEVRVYNFIFILIPYSMIRRRKRKTKQLK